MYVWMFACIYYYYYNDRTTTTTATTATTTALTTTAAATAIITTTTATFCHVFRVHFKFKYRLMTAPALPSEAAEYTFISSAKRLADCNR